MAKKVIVELRTPFGFSMESIRATNVATISGFEMDFEYKPVPINPPAEIVRSLASANEETILVRGELDESKEIELKALPNVVNIWTDARIETFGIDCEYTIPKGTIEDVAKYLGCDQLWAKGVKGKGIVIGICDTGVDNSKVSAVIDGFSSNSMYPPGTDPGGHGSMCATDALGMCPEAKIYDLGILKSNMVSGVISDAISAYQWAIEKYGTDGTPQILSNSWGMYQKAWAPDYAENPDHPFTRKVVEAIDTGIIVTFAAGNCGSQCLPASNKCRLDVGPGKSIWGANGHPKVITVGAANICEQWIGYTSQGPAALDSKKPDFCAPSHFKGYTDCDNGTSAANPVCAGVIGLLKSYDPTLTLEVIKDALQKTAKDLCDSGWDPHSGYGIIQAEAAFNKIVSSSVSVAHPM
ncbi:MAG TPA: S8 family serine peptidase [Methanosarcina sp.]